MINNTTIFLEPLGRFLKPEEWPPLSAFMILQGISTIIASWITGSITYNLYFHPLANYPGPFWAKVSLFWRFWHSMQGNFHRVIEANHQKHGDVFRVSPNELSFCTASAYKTIYSTRTSAELKIPKDKFYDVFGLGFNEPCISCEKDPEKAGAKRSLFAGAFSAKSLAEQEIIMQLSINTFTHKVGSLGSSNDGIDMRKWYEMVSFDILGQMAFGESFNCVKNESSHFWLDMILGHIFAIAIMDNLSRIPFFIPLMRALPKNKLMQQQSDFSREKVKRRLEIGVEQKDFLTNVSKKVLSGDVPQEEMAAHSSTFVIAGGETTATSMTAITYYLLKHPLVHEKLKREVRSQFKSFEEIDVVRSGQCTYLQAVIKEGMRILPANSQGLPRRCPGIEVDGHFVPAGTEFYVSPWTMAHDTRYWHEPYIFKPERWTDPDCKDNKAASQPFSMGPRACIGKNFAYAQMSLELAKLVYAYDMELVNPELDYANDCRMYFMWYKPEMRVRFKHVSQD